ncbi:hypothetical protein L1887_53669 [Cichorium endivia]|nr:hypothetical protein L1887_53669 [Cichorium endivia]
MLHRDERLTDADPLSTSTHVSDRIRFFCPVADQSPALRLHRAKKELLSKEKASATFRCQRPTTSPSPCFSTIPILPSVSASQCSSRPLRRVSPSRAACFSPPPLPPLCAPTHQRGRPPPPPLRHPLASRPKRRRQRLCCTSRSYRPVRRLRPRSPTRAPPWRLSRASRV